MGKRKERRLAALSNAGRRVKLDLFAEPSGDLGGSSVNGEVGEDIDPTKRAELPNSPSSSGQQLQNPLLLLGQYSDEELFEESNERLNHADAENSSLDHGGQEGPLGEGKGVDANAVEDLTEQKGELQEMERDSTPVDVLQSLEGGDSGESDSAASTDKGKEIDLAKQASVTGTPDAQVNADVCSGWRIVMHEESNQYYYWNTETGETSWEVPEVLAQTTHLIVPPTEIMETIPVDTNQSSSTSGIELDSSSAAASIGGSVSASLVSQSQEVHVNGPQMSEWLEVHKGDSVKEKNSITDVCQSEPQSNLSAANVLCSGEATNDELENGMDLPSNLMRQCECLLERLKSLKGYGSRLQCQGQMSKYILEVDIRLSDIKSLSSYASSLLPFWIHSQRQLKQLEDVINNEIYHLAVSSQMDDDVDATANAASNEKEKSCEIVGHDFDADGCENSRKSELPNFTATVENDSHNDLPHENVNARLISSLGLSDEHLKGGAAASEKVDGTAYPEPEFLPGEDVDMDVDMEVDDGVSAGITTVEDASSTKVFAPVNQLSRPNAPAEYATLPSGDESTVPLPPEEDWIPPPPPDSDQVPPPPPDNEQIPPPPPDEPPESSYPPVQSYMEMGQPLPYAEQYNLPYPDSNFQYYGPTVTVPTSNLYGHADGSQVAMTNASLYYEVVANTYAETAPIIVSPVDPVAYYNIQDASMVPLPAVSISKSSHLHDESCPMGFSTLASDQIRTGNDPIEAARKLELDVSAVAGKTVTASMGVASPSVIETPAAANGKENISAPSTNVVTASAAVPNTMTAPKGQSKVSRTKKRTVAVASSLRSNKKVSSLVDKWKAAKEELNENEEDEPENAYEILERKRQREIEEWRAKQIASGEAKDNANFQPLGGDWRERVKRRRAQAAKEAAQLPSEASIVANQQLDLAELSKGLPSGWQAYWDEASKQVYYGNVVTSETSWIKPTK
ncbi:conserved hypothetical protein [Ricinus communis]|uniref:WW domain-containing protein n=1 Tax=Ricinus communis TaxID=3988 RepID=B9T2P3_RICCO|nr:conserved hypothetical protein [Ricinus communis]|eukprot:XP_002532512.1 uncharacterized protein LOC8275726 isoform X1 [Ricinus communis]